MTEEAPAPKGKNLISRLMVAGFMGGVILVECVLAYAYLPSSDEIRDSVPEANVADDKAKKEKRKVKPVIEVTLGSYTITLHSPSEGSTLRVDFDLVGTILEKDRRQFEELFARNENRLRDQVLVEIRTAEMTELTDPGLGLIKRRILAKSNTLFGKPILRSILFSQFSFMDE